MSDFFVNGAGLLAATPFIQATGFVLFGMILLVLVISLWLGHLAGKSLRMPEHGGRISVILGAALIALTVILTGVLRWGVDLRGGVNYIGQLNLSEWKDMTTAPDLSDIIPRLMSRVDPSGTREIMIRPLDKDKIEVTIPDVEISEADEIWNRLVKTGHLLFRIVADSEYHPSQIQRAMDKMQGGDLGDRVVVTDDTGNTKVVAKWYTIAHTEPESGRRIADQVLPFKYLPFGGQKVRVKETGQLLNMSDLPFGGKNGELSFARYCKEKGYKNVQVLLVEPDNESTNVEGKHLTQSTSELDEMGRPCVGFKLTSEGSSRMGRLTSQNRPRDERYRQLAIVLDEQLQSAPRIEEPIFRNGRITGNFTTKEVDELCVSLNSGKIDVAMNKTPISRDYLKSTLGEELKSQGYWAIGISLVLVLGFMLVYYQWFAGTVSCIALLFNIVLILACVIAIKQPLTLTGLAGLVLTVGMSVDANVLIFERIREELARGATLRMSINNGFEKATTTIIDANVTTLFTALVLYVFGTEQLKGFAVTLILGILMSMFTAVYCARAIFEIAERKRWVTSISMMQIFPAQNFRFLNKQGVAITGSIIVILIGMIGMFALGNRILDIDLKGGSTARVITNEVMKPAEILDRLNDQKIEVKGDKIIFVVSEIDDDEFKNRSFKIDSSLPAPTENDDWKPLDQVIQDAFPTELKRHELKFKILETREALPGDNRVGSWKSNSRLTQLSAGYLTSAPSILGHSMVTTGDARFLQEKQEQSGTESTATNQTTQSDAPPTQSTAPTQSSEKQEGTGDAQTPPSGGDLQAPQSRSVINKQFVSKSNLEFANPISANSVKTLFKETAERIDRSIDEEQIIVTSPNSSTEDNGNELSTEWTVSLKSSGENDASDILKAFQADFNNKVYFPTTSGVGSQIASRAQLQAMWAILLSLLGIIAYVWVRFQSLAYGLAAVLALIHDVLVVLGAIAISNFAGGYLGFLKIDDFKISLTVLAAILTVIGYSLNDTIVIFDRIREIRGKRTEMTEEMIDQSISQTLSRTILTSLTTFVVVFILYLFGGESIHAFAFSLVVGIVAGTYSTIFIASPSLLWFMRWFGFPDEPAVAKPIG